MNRKIIYGAFLAFLIVILIVEPALAGPGGKIAKVVAETFWGKVALVLLTIGLSPLIAYVFILEKLAENRTRKDLRCMANYSPIFEYLNIHQRAKDCFLRIHSGWQEEDLSKISSWMTDWYWKNQQLVYLDKWKREGLINVCDVKSINYIKPLLFRHRNHGKEHEGSIIVLLIEANMKDFLQDRITGEVKEGSKQYKDVETVWTFTLKNGVWKVSDIDEGNMALAYAKMIKDLPKIESTIISKHNA